MNCYILDDEPFAIDYLKNFIEKTPGLKLTGTATDPAVAMQEITGDCPVDLTFADVQMPGINGLEFAAIMEIYTAVIFTTAHRQHAFEAFEHNAIDYLLKPYSYERFLKSVNKAKRYLRESPAQRSVGEQFIYVKAGQKGKINKVQLADIVYIEGALNYINIQLESRSIMTYSSMESIFRALPPQHFSRIHKSFIINNNAIVSVEKGQVTLRGKKTLNIGRSYSEAFYNYMDSFRPKDKGQTGD
ncbi:response regulator [Pedobacter sp. HMF7647]|uniref:Response regulator n=1 Tax=Hufsiella arboris TaxID=2695275 RepID=A0A7K1Y8I8_9SPHI|nr:LytTR family DNA-binding domain-containing protein [Hufsiella arboris]MXV50358.1 response regulator [Hufsiella arboris]